MGTWNSMESLENKSSESYANMEWRRHPHLQIQASIPFRQPQVITCLLLQNGHHFFLILMMTTVTNLAKKSGILTCRIWMIWTSTTKVIDFLTKIMKMWRKMMKTMLISMTAQPFRILTRKRKSDYFE